MKGLVSADAVKCFYLKNVLECQKEKGGKINIKRNRVINIKWL